MDEAVGTGWGHSLALLGVSWTEWGDKMGMGGSVGTGVLL